MSLKKILAALSVFALSCANVSAADYAIGAFFTSDSDLQMQVYRTADMIHMDHIYRSETVAGRDFSCRYYNGAFYTCLVEPIETGRTFKILKSVDFVNWNETGFKVVERDEKTPAVWAPDLFIDSDGAAYVYFAKQSDYKSKGRERTFDIYVSKATNIEKLDFGRAQKVDLADYDNVIDAHIHRVGGNYYMIIKDETWRTNNDNKSPHLFRSNNPVNGFVEIKDWPLRAVRGCEGFFVVEKDGKIYIYADNYSGKYDAAPTSHHTVWITDDIERGPFRAEYVESARPMRHGSMIAITDPKINAALSYATPDVETPTAEPPFKTITIERDDYGTGKGHNIIIDDFAPAPNVIYRVPKKTHVTINNLVNAYGVERMDFELAAGAEIVIENVLRRENVDSKDKRLTFRYDGNGWNLAQK